MREREIPATTLVESKGEIYRESETEREGDREREFLATNMVDSKGEREKKKVREIKREREQLMGGSLHLTGIFLVGNTFVDLIFDKKVNINFTATLDIHI